MITIVEPDLPKGRTGMSATESQVGHLAELARAGDRASFEQLVSLFHNEIFRMVYYRSGSRMDAEDLTQEIFVKAFRSMPTLNDIYRFRPWLYRIAVNRVHDFHRKRRFLVFFGSEGEGKEFESADRQTHHDPEALGHLMRQEFWEQVRGFTGKLGRWEREVFLLRFLDQLGIREIAQVLHKSESAVKTHLYRALRKFKGNPEIVCLLEAKCL